MRFGEQVVLFDYVGIPMVGNVDNGYVIGLTGEGAEVCHRAAAEDVPPEDIAAVDEQLLFHLERGGFFATERKGHTLQSAYVHVTQRCNLDCVGCYSDDDDRNCTADAGFEDFTRALDQLARCGATRLVISGGEPFLRKDLADIVRHGKKQCGFEHIEVLTNGTVVDKDQLEAMAPYVSRIAVSVDGYAEDCIPYIRRKQRYADLVQTIESIKEAGIPTHIIPTVHAKNVDDLEAYSAMADRLGVTMSFSLLTCPADTEGSEGLIPTDDDLIALSRATISSGGSRIPVIRDTPVNTSLTVRNACGAGRQTLSVGADGSVYPCHMLHDDKLKLGSIFTDDLEDILAGEASSEFAQLGVDRFDTCSHCEIRYLCGGGCRARSFYASGTVHAKDPYCALMQDFYSQLANKMLATT